MFPLMEQALAQTATTTPKDDNFFSALVGNTGKFILIGVIFVLSLIVARLLVYRIVEAIKKNQKEEEYQEVMLVTSRLLYIVFAVTGLGLGLGLTDTFSNLGWLFGAIGLGIGFAMQSIVGNFVAGITLLIQRKVRIGDYIEINGFKGIVTSIGSRATVVHDFDGTDILIPNLEFFNQYVRVYTANPYRRIHIEMSVGYDTDFAKAYDVIFNVLKKYPDVEQEPPPDILCDRLDDSTLNLTIRWWIRSSLRWWTLQSDIMRDVFVELQRNGVNIPFPIQTLRVDKEDSDVLFEAISKKLNT